MRTDGQPSPPTVLGYRSLGAGCPTPTGSRRRRTDRIGLRITNAIVAAIGLLMLAPCVLVVAAAVPSGRSDAIVCVLLCVCIPAAFGLTVFVAGVVGYRRAGRVDDSPV